MPEPPGSSFGVATKHHGMRPRAGGTRRWILLLRSESSVLHCEVACCIVRNAKQDSSMSFFVTAVSGQVADIGL